jgi:hypothetical protein
MGFAGVISSFYLSYLKYLEALFIPKKSGGRLNFVFVECVYFLRSISNTPTATAAIIAIVEPAM